MRRKRGLPLMLASAALLSTAGCATNALRVEYAGNVATQGKAAAAASREFLGKVDTTRDETSVDLFAADAACARSPAIVRQNPRGPADPKVRGWLCVPEPETGAPGDPRLSLRPIAAELEPTLALTDSLTSYAESLAEIVEAKPADPAQGFTDALTTALAAQDAFVAVLGGSGGPIPGADDPRVKAVTSFIGFLGELAGEAGKVRELRALILANPDGAELIIAQLRTQLKAWDNSRKTDLALRQSVDALTLRHLANLPDPAPASMRRDALAAFYKRGRDYRASAQLFPALDSLLQALLVSDRDLRRVLRENPDLTAKERAKVAEINRKRIVRALEGVTALITSFRGV